MDEFTRARTAYLDKVGRAVRRHAGPVAASHESSAVALTLPTLDVPSRVELTRPDGHRRNGRTHVHVAELRRDEVVTVGGIPVTAPARTVLDIARCRPFIEALIPADAALRRGLPAERLEAELARMRRWPGARAAAAVVQWADPRSESPVETVVRGRCIQLGLPVPEPQKWICAGGRWWRVDHWWEEFNVVGESDGRVKYEQMDDLWDEKKRYDAIHDAHHVIRWTWRQALAPDEVFRGRLMEAFRRGLRLRALLAS